MPLNIGRPSLLNNAEILLSVFQRLVNYVFFLSDLNECLNKFQCAKHAKCLNVPGSYKCECKPGFVGDGKYCNGTSPLEKCAIAGMGITMIYF